MRIENETKYATRELRTIFCRVHTLVAKYEGRLPQWKALRVHVVYTRNREHSGYAYLRGYYMKLCLQRGSISRYTVASLFAHELMHSYGYRHSEMASRGRADPVELTEFTGTTLDEQKPKPKAKPSTAELQAQRYGRVLERERRWQSKLKRAQTALRKLKRQRKYYECVLDKAAKK
jgi:hypothetical protein